MADGAINVMGQNVTRLTATQPSRAIVLEHGGTLTLVERRGGGVVVLPVPV